MAPGWPITRSTWCPCRSGRPTRICGSRASSANTRMARKLASHGAWPVDSLRCGSLNRHFTWLSGESTSTRGCDADPAVLPCTTYATTCAIPAHVFLPRVRRRADLGATATVLPTRITGSAARPTRIIGGAKPADLLVEHAVKIRPVLNLKAAKALGLEVPGTRLARLPVRGSRAEPISIQAESGV